MNEQILDDLLKVRNSGLCNMGMMNEVLFILEFLEKYETKEYINNLSAKEYFDLLNNEFSKKVKEFNSKFNKEEK